MSLFLAIIFFIALFLFATHDTRKSSGAFVQRRSYLKGKNAVLIDGCGNWLELNNDGENVHIYEATVDVERFSPNPPHKIEFVTDNSPLDIPYSEIDSVSVNKFSNEGSKDVSVHVLFKTKTRIPRSNITDFIKVRSLNPKGIECILKDNLPGIPVVTKDYGELKKFQSP